MRPTTHSTRGFTLVESMAVMTVLAAIGSITSALIFTAVTGYKDASLLAQIHNEESSAMARIGTEIRKIPLATVSASPVPGITAVAPSSMSWNGYTLALSGGQVLLTEPGGTAQPLLANATALTIQCYDENNSALAGTLSGALCDPIRRVSVTVTVQREGITDSLRCRFFLRAAMQGGVP